MSGARKWVRMQQAPADDCGAVGGEIEEEQGAHEAQAPLEEHSRSQM